MNRETSIEQVQSWILGAEDALEMAEQQIESKRPLWCIFFCHLAVEKALKAAVIQKTGKQAPKTHILRYLVGLAGLSTEGAPFEFISMLSDVSVPTRYPEDFGGALAGYSNDVAGDYLARAKEVVDWISKSVKP